MNSEAICRFNQNGYCKYKNHCFRKHVDKICENGRCSASNCNLRHPRNCKYFFQYRYCKFGQFCRFNHEEKGKEHANEEIDILKLDACSGNFKLVQSKVPGRGEAGPEGGHDAEIRAKRSHLDSCVKV